MEKLDLEAADKARLFAQAGAALRTSVGPAYRRLIPALGTIATSAQPGAGVQRLPEGDADYADRMAFHTLSDRAEIARAVERYATTPGQATAYAIGKLEILKPREKAKSTMADQFDIRGFHDVVLRSGPVPLDILAETVRAWASSS